MTQARCRALARCAGMIAALAVAIAPTALLASPAFGSGPQHRPAPVNPEPDELLAPHRPQTLLVRFPTDQIAQTLATLNPGESPAASDPASPAAQILDDLGARVVRVWSLVPGLAELHVPTPLANALLVLRAKEDVFVYAAPDHIQSTSGDLPACHTAPDAPFVNDPHFPRLYGMLNLGRPINGSPASAGIDINVDSAWRVFTGDPSLIIAVIDSGMDVTHPDLVPNIYVNIAERDGLPGVDDDANGFIDDVRGWDFVENDNDPSGTSLNRHGTHVAGTIAAAGNNALGVTGVLHHARLLPCKFISGTDGPTSAAISAIEYAVQMGAKISNNSWGSAAFNIALYDAIIAAGNAGHLFVAAAGNNARNIDTSPYFPACYDAENIIAVANLTPSGVLNIDSNFGFNYVDIAAPGTNIFSTIESGQYGYLTGTSMAAPHVTGVAALILQRYPAWTWPQVKQRLLETARPLSTLYARVTTGGIVSAADAIGASIVSPFHPPIGALAAPPAAVPPRSDFIVDAFIDPGSDTVAAARLFWRTAPSAPYAELPMTQVGADRWTAAVRADTCAEFIEYAVQYSGALSGCFTVPPDASTSPARVRVGSVAAVWQDPFESSSVVDWSLAAPLDTATSGHWTWGVPIATALPDGPAQPGEDNSPAHDAVNCFFTGQHTPGAPVGENDVDSGFTSLISPAFSVVGLSAPRLSYARWFYPGGPDDSFTVSISADDGQSWTTLERLEFNPDLPPTNQWTIVAFDLRAAFPSLPLTASMRLRFVAEDAGPSSVVEAAVDDFNIENIACTPPCPGDYDLSGHVSVQDIFAFISDYFAALPSADFDGNTRVEVGDLFAFVVAWFSCP